MSTYTVDLEAVAATGRELRRHSLDIEDAGSLVSAPDTGTTMDLTADSFTELATRITDDAESLEQLGSDLGLVCDIAEDIDGTVATAYYDLLLYAAVR